MSGEIRLARKTATVRALCCGLLSTTRTPSSADRGTLAFTPRLATARCSLRAWPPAPTVRWRARITQSERGRSRSARVLFASSVRGPSYRNGDAGIVRALRRDECSLSAGAPTVAERAPPSGDGCGEPNRSPSRVSARRVTGEPPRARRVCQSTQRQLRTVLPICNAAWPSSLPAAISRLLPKIGWHPEPKQ
jgi:hypothetical protein